MDNLNYLFFDEYKRLDKLCGDLYETPYGISHYIDDMKEISRIQYQYIPNWKNDMQQLIRLRHIRNDLAHRENAFQDQICTQEDIDWIRNFYERILNRSYP